MNSDESQSSSRHNHFQRYFQYAESILATYNGVNPFHLFLKKYFAHNKKHGSRDRKIISSLCYHLFRLGGGVSYEMSFEEKVSLSIYLSETTSSAILENLSKDWNDSIHESLEHKIITVRERFNPNKVFPFLHALSAQIDPGAFNLSFLRQPKVFIRIRPGFESIVTDKIFQAGLHYERLNNQCIAFSRNERISEVIEINKEAVIQDCNSQQTLNIVKNKVPDEMLAVWDCCAGSGGKSILAFDTFKKANLTVSDKRKSILQNLRIRFERAGIKDYKLILANLERPAMEVKGPFDLIIADVPCSGSGTWSRTPEQLTFFKHEEIEKYSSLQKKIIENVFLQLKAGGLLLYITCSVFAKENEQNVAFIQTTLPLKLLGTEYLKGYEIGADTLFVALFRKGC